MHYRTYVTIAVAIMLVGIASGAGAEEKKAPSIESQVCSIVEPSCKEGLAYHCTRHAYAVPGPRDKPGTTLAWSRTCGCRATPPSRKEIWPLQDRTAFCLENVGNWDWRRWAHRNDLAILDVWTWIANEVKERAPSPSDL